MAWVAIQNNPYWEYDDDPPDPGGALTALWSTGSCGIRVNCNGQQLYMNCRKIGSNAPSVPSEISKTYWDARQENYRLLTENDFQINTEDCKVLRT